MKPLLVLAPSDFIFNLWRQRTAMRHTTTGDEESATRVRQARFAKVPLPAYVGPETYDLVVVNEVPWETDDQVRVVETLRRVGFVVEVNDWV